MVSVREVEKEAAASRDVDTDNRERDEATYRDEVSETRTERESNPKDTP